MLLLAVTGVLWGSIGLVVRLLQDRGEPTVTIAFWRFVGASAVLAFLLGPSGRRALARQARRPARLVAVVPRRGQDGGRDREGVSAGRFRRSGTRQGRADDG